VADSVGCEEADEPNERQPGVVEEVVEQLDGGCGAHR
jgi:hypothetical protein